MEHGFSEDLQGRTGGSKKEHAESAKPELHVEHKLDESKGNKGDTLQLPRPRVDVGEEEGEEVFTTNEDDAGEISMEAAISAGDVVRAGGFGARDAINSLLPVASDCTDFEATLLDARDYEEPQQEIKRPGLGWREAKN